MRSTTRTKGAAPRAVLVGAVTMGLAIGVCACSSSVDGPPGSSGVGGEGASGTGQTTGTGASSSDTGTSTGVTGTATSTATGTTNPGGCAGACAHLQALGCNEAGPECQQDCEAANTSARCAKVFDDVVACVAATPTCDIEEYCEVQFNAYIQCLQTTDCGPPECSGGGTSGGEEECACQAVCSGQQVEAACSSNAGGQAACTCYVNGQVVAECTEPTSTFCDLDVGCCAQFFD